MSSYTLLNNETFNCRIERDLAQITAAVCACPESRYLAGLVLGGGYGRGEGGIYYNDQGEPELYNDLDFFVITHHVSRRIRRQLDAALRQVSEQLREKIGVDVDFGPAVNLDALPRLPVTLMWQELKLGHRVIYGPPDLLASLPACNLTDLPVLEGAKLLLNRGTGVVLARRQLTAGPATQAELDFIGRNLIKAILGCGDAMLIANHAYSATINERLALLRHHVDLASLVDNYELALNFKAAPRTMSSAELTTLLEHVMALFRQTYLAFFQQSYRMSLPTIPAVQTAIATVRLPGEAMGASALFKNFLLNLLRWRGGCDWWRLCWRHPQIRLFLVFPVLLFDSEALRDYLFLLPGVTPGCAAEKSWYRYLEQWRLFN